MSLHPPLRHGRLHDEEAAAAVQEPEAAEPVEVVGEDVSTAPEERRFPSTIGGVCYLVVLGLATAGLAIVVGGAWRFGLVWVACSLGIAAICRAALRTRDAGMLAVRNRWLDIGLLIVAGAGIWVLALTVPGY